jgi:hypothetical protein
MDSQEREHTPTSNNQGHLTTTVKKDPEAISLKTLVYAMSHTSES